MPLLPPRPASAESNAGPSYARLPATSTRQLAAACGALAAAAEIIVAPVTLGSTVVFIGISRLTRSSSVWLVLPALAGLAWAGLEGPGQTARRFLAVGVHVAALVAAPGTVPARLARLPQMFAQWRAGLAGQMPLALVAAAAQAAVLGDVRGRRRTRQLRADCDAAGRGAAGQDNARRLRPVSAVRRAYQTAMVRRGEVATTEGALLGISRDTGRRMTLSWAEAAGGVLITGRDPDSVNRTGLDLAVAAIQHRKAVIIADLSGRPGPIAPAVAAACSDRQIPLRIWPGADAAVANLGRPDLAELLAWRQVLLAQPGPELPAAELAQMVAAWLTGALAERRALGVRADGLAWFNACERVGDEALGNLVACARNGALPLVLATVTSDAAARLADEAGTIVVRGQAPRGWPRGGTPGVPAELLAGQHRDDLALLVRGARSRMVTGSRAMRRSQAMR